MTASRSCAACGYSVMAANWDNHKRGQTHRTRAVRWAEKMLDHQFADMVRALEERDIYSVGDLENHERQIAADALALGMGAA